MASTKGFTLRYEEAKSEAGQRQQCSYMMCQDRDMIELIECSWFTNLNVDLQNRTKEHVKHAKFESARCDPLHWSQEMADP